MPDELAVFLGASLTGISIILFAIALTAYRRLKNLKFLLIGLAFFLFALSGIIVLASVFIGVLEVWFPFNANILLIYFAVVILLYFSMLKK